MSQMIQNQEHELVYPCGCISVLLVQTNGCSQAASPCPCTVAPLLGGSSLALLNRPHAGSWIDDWNTVNMFETHSSSLTHILCVAACPGDVCLKPHLSSILFSNVIISNFYLPDRICKCGGLRDNIKGSLVVKIPDSLRGAGTCGVKYARNSMPYVLICTLEFLAQNSPET